jgi:hypothetical protein
MTSAAKAESNRRNAQRSTGPRTAAGKARVSRNAYRHGLSFPFRADVTDVQVGDYLRAFETEFGGASREQATRAAEGQSELLRIRRIKAELLNREAGRLQERDASSPKSECMAGAFVGKAKILESLDRYERRALSKRRGALRKLRSAVVPKGAP